MDTDGDGKVNQDELKVLTDKIKSDTDQDVSQDFSKLDTDGDGTITWGELRTRRDELADWALAQLSVQRGGAVLTDGEG